MNYIIVAFLTNEVLSQPAIICSKLTIETLVQGVKYGLKVKNLLQHRQKYKLLSISMQRPWSVSVKNIFADIIGRTFIGQITFSRNFKKNWKKNVNFRQLLKIILKNENSFLQIHFYRNSAKYLLVSADFCLLKG